MKIKYVLICIIALFAYNNLQAQYKLELEWQKEPGGSVLEIFDITKSDNDSLLYLTSWNSIYTIKSTDGIVVKIDTTDFSYAKLIMSKDSKTIITTTSNLGEKGIGLLEPITFKRKFWVNYPNFTDITYNEKQNKFVANYSPDIRIFDVATQKLYKEYNTDKALNQANITDDGKYIIYSYRTYTTKPDKTHYFIRILDLEGNLLKEIKELSSGKFSFTIDGKTLICFDSLSTHFYDLETFQEKIKFQIGGNIENIEMSPDGKFMLISKGHELYYLEFDTGRTFLLNDDSSWGEGFKLNSTGNELYLGVAFILVKLKIISLNSLPNDNNKFVVTLDVRRDYLYINIPQNSNPTNNFQIISLDGKLQRNIMASEIQHIANGVKIDINTLSSGVYFLQIQEGNNIVTTLKFLKVD